MYQEFIDEAVRIYQIGGKTQAELASDLGCRANSISRWVKQHKQKEEALLFILTGTDSKDFYCLINLRV
ncbi:transposase [Flavivirga jejuensis]|uniref:transposase n=1 Tax=Flavivirga jejuensis TaxID=870487 RepID=UPI00349E8A63